MTNHSEDEVPFPAPDPGRSKHQRASGPTLDENSVTAMAGIGIGAIATEIGLTQGHVAGLGAALRLSATVAHGRRRAALSAGTGDQVAHGQTQRFQPGVPIHSVITELADLRMALTSSVAIWAGGASPALRRKLPAGVKYVEGLESVEEAVAVWLRDAML